MIGTEDAAFMQRKFLSCLEEVFTESSLLRMILDDQQDGIYLQQAMRNSHLRELRMFIYLADLLRNGLK